MAAVCELEFFLLQYVPNAARDEAVNIGVVLTKPGGTELIDARFASDWNRVLALDPDADVEVLQALAREMQNEIQLGRGAVWLQRMKDSFSNAAQLSGGRTCETDDPASKINELASAYL
jgi:Protein of unknown function (DUF3037)